MRIGDCEIKIVNGDITDIAVDAIVNAANNKLLMGGGVAGAIKRKGGVSIEDEAVKKGPIETGGAVATSAGALRARYVIHAATMGMDFKTDEIKIRKSCASALKVADELKIKSIAFPALGCGVGGFPLKASAKIMAQEVMKHLREANTYLREIIFCMHEKEAYEVFDKNVAGYIDYMLTKQSRGPFVAVDAIIDIDGGIVIVERSNPPFGWALPGGFVDNYESLEDAVRREMMEETSLELLDLKQFHAYSKPGRDPRFHTIGIVFTARGKGTPKAGDDAANLKIIKLTDIGKIPFAFDHKQILEDYIKFKKDSSLPV
ncbi:MAG: macro domain-containing protein [Candidatus Omnitrophota bacterium]|jgi:O-acetyl-ADP-ribose deacetylase (regulator of RNase III)/ADP-ribose pyrophosphatase YjhB (NUDIX family)